MMDHAFDSTEARDMNRRIFETIYHAALQSSCENADARTYKMMLLRDFYQGGMFTFENPSDTATKAYVLTEDKFENDEERNFVETLLDGAVKALTPIAGT